MKGNIMFGYNYKMRTINEDKGIVRLTPTKGTYAKAVLPSLIMSAVGVVVLYALSFAEEPVRIDLTDEFNPYRKD